MEQSNQDRLAAPTPRNRSWTRWIMIGGFAALSIGGIGAASAVAAGGMGPGSMGMHFAQRSLDRALDEVNASPEQETRIREILARVQGELAPKMAEFADARTAVLDLLGAETIDRQALERLRTERIAAIDAAT